MHIELGKLCVKNSYLCTTLCVNFNKKEPFPCILLTYLIKKVMTKKSLYLLKVQIFPEFYVLLYTLYLHLSNTTHLTRLIMLLKQ